jgi:hypothetical protein
MRFGFARLFGDRVPPVFRFECLAKVAGLRRTIKVR